MTVVRVIEADLPQVRINAVPAVKVNPNPSEFLRLSGRVAAPINASFNMVRMREPCETNQQLRTDSLSSSIFEQMCELARHCSGRVQVVCRRRG